MAAPGEPAARHLGLWGATGVGVGAIVGGGILALSGVAFATAGPSAILAFALNGALAALTARSFAAMASAFPESGGTYTFAKKVLPVETAFIVGWVVWFASIVAAVLYALGFGAFAAALLARVWPGSVPAWLGERPTLVGLAAVAVGIYTLGLARRRGGGGQWATVGKVLAFVALIVAGAVVFARTPASVSLAPLRPFFARGGIGLVEAMGYTFIALQGFDLIAAVGGEVREPRRNLPRSMYLSLAIAMAIYLPLLFLVATVGAPPGSSIEELARANPDTAIAAAAGNFLGGIGWWLVVLAAILSMLSALRANLYGASRMAFAMGRDRTLPVGLAELRAEGGVPVRAVLATAAAVVAIAVLIPDVAVAGAASSLIFLVSFAMVHWTSILVWMRRAGPPVERRGRRRALFAPLAGVAACLGLAAFQGFAVPAAGALVAVWLVVGMTLYLVKLAPRARVADASAQAYDPELSRLRGLSPLVMVPIANPVSAESLVSAASCLAAPGVGRVLLLSVVKPPESVAEATRDRQLVDVQAVLGKSLVASFEDRIAPEVLITLASEPWEEIERAARVHRCETVLLGLGRLDDEAERRVERLMGRVDANVVVLRAPSAFRLARVKRVLVPVGGRRDQSYLRARLLTSLWRAGVESVTYLHVQAPDVPAELGSRVERGLRELARDELPGRARIVVTSAADPLAEVARHTEEAELVVLGIQRRDRRRKVFGSLPLNLARRSDVPILLLSRRG